MNEPRDGAHPDLFERSYAAFNSGDVAELLSLYTEDCVWDISRFREGFGAGLARVYLGHDGLVEFLEEAQVIIAPWGGARIEFDRVVDLGDRRFWLEGDIRFGSPEGSAELFDRWVQLLRVRGDRLSEVVMYWDADEAARDAGLDAAP